MGRPDFEQTFRRAIFPATQLAATGAVYAQGKQGMVTVFSLTAGVDAATAVVRTGGATGTIIAAISAAIGTTQPVSYPAGLYFSDGVHVTLTGTAPAFDTVGVADDA